ncbi:MAG TPA: hypothetical protein VGD31_11870, partial [Sphingobacteriaceae bacterium]
MMKFSNEGWKYMRRMVRKHYFDNLNSITAICGAATSPHRTEKWKDDEEGLNAKRECGKCRNILER